MMFFFSFDACTFGIIPKKPLPHPRSQKFILLFSPKRDCISSFIRQCLLMLLAENQFSFLLTLWLALGITQLFNFHLSNGYHWLNGHEFEHTLEDSEGQGSLTCCSPWGHKESDTIYWLNHNKMGIQSEVSHWTFETNFNIFSPLGKIWGKWWRKERGSWLGGQDQEVNFGGLLEPLCNPRDRQSGLGPPRGEGSTAVGVWEDGFPGSLAGRHSTHISEAGVAASQRILGPPRGWNPALPPGRLFFLLFPSHFPLGN